MTPGKRLISQRDRFSSLQTGSSAKSLPDPANNATPTNTSVEHSRPRAPPTLLLTQRGFALPRSSRRPVEH